MKPSKRLPNRLPVEKHLAIERPFSVREPSTEFLHIRMETIKKGAGIMSIQSSILSSLVLKSPPALLSFFSLLYLVGGFSDILNYLYTLPSKGFRVPHLTGDMLTRRFSTQEVV